MNRNPIEKNIVDAVAESIQKTVKAIETVSDHDQDCGCTQCRESFKTIETASSSILDAASKIARKPVD